jgi:glycine betaine/choline ABC-type transport system substrate-binding protein
MPVRFTALLVCVLLAVPAAAQQHQLDTLSPAQAVSRAAAASPKSVRAVFEFKVQNAARSHGGYYLDSERDFHSASNLGVMIRPSAVPGLTKKYGEDLKSALVGKTVKIIGQVRRRVVAGGTATATQIEVTHAGQILSVS